MILLFLLFITQLLLSRPQPLWCVCCYNLIFALFLKTVFFLITSICSGMGGSAGVFGSCEGCYSLKKSIFRFALWLSLAVLPGLLQCKWAGLRAYLWRVDGERSLRWWQQGHIKLLRDISDSWDFVLVRAPRVQDALWRVVQLLCGIKAHSLNKRTFDLKGDNFKPCEKVFIYLATTFRKGFPAPTCPTSMAGFRLQQASMTMSVLIFWDR